MFHFKANRYKINLEDKHPVIYFCHVNPDQALRFIKIRVLQAKLIRIRNTTEFLGKIQCVFGSWKILGDPEVTANIYCKSRNLPNTETQNYSKDLRSLLSQPVKWHFFCAKVWQENNFIFRRKLKPGNFRFHEQDIDYRMQAYRTVRSQYRLVRLAKSVLHISNRINTHLTEKRPRGSLILCKCRLKETRAICP